MVNRLSLMAASTLWAYLTACGSPLYTTESPYRNNLLATERALGKQPLTYATDSDNAPFSPDGLVSDPHDPQSAWVTSYGSRKQIRIHLDAQRRLMSSQTRHGPSGTRRCFVVNSQDTWCVGQHEPHGVAALSTSIPPLALPQRQGFVDGLVQPSTGNVFVLDSVHPALWRFPADETTPVVTELSGVVRQLVDLDRGTIAIVSAYPPGIWVHSPDQSQVFHVSTDAPQRAAAYDSARNILWTAGPAESNARRHLGPIHQLSAAVFGWDADVLRHGRKQLRYQLRLGPMGLADPTSISVIQDGIVVTLGANNAVLWWTPDNNPIVCSTDVHPTSSMPFSGGLLVTNRLGDSVTWFSEPNSCIQQTLVLDPHPRDGLKYWGEYLFYGLRDSVPQTDAPYTCNSCHWDTGKDHRRQPGFLEQRWEMTRSLAGIRGVLPLFTTGFGTTMADSIEGLLRGLDPRFWDTNRADPSYWQNAAILQTKGVTPVELSAAQQREALLHYLLSLQPQVGPLRLPGRGFSQQADHGAALFWTHCAPCHQPQRTLRNGDPVSDRIKSSDEMLVVLRTTPLVFGAKAFSQIPGIAAFTPYGNRIAPLFELWRGGPFFSDGSAPDLRTLLRRFVPGSASGHGGDPVPARSLTDQEIDQLWTFLLSL